MVGITLSPDEIRSAPPEVRRWLERGIATALDRQREPAGAQDGAEHLVACSQDEAAAIYASVRSVLPVVNLFFELGREGESVGRGDIEAFALVDMLRHARLQNLEQLSACLQVLNEVARRIRGDAHATLALLDGHGGCLVARQTQRSILGAWRQVIAGQGSAGEQAAASAGPPPTLTTASATIPRAAIHMGGAFAGDGAAPDGGAQQF
jgi:hypothetical protein